MSDIFNHVHFYERTDGRENHGGGVVCVFINRAAVGAHSSPPTQLPSGVKQQIHTYQLHGQVLARLLSSAPASQCGRRLTVASGQTPH